jgi:hypothetical protein
LASPTVLICPFSLRLLALDLCWSRVWNGCGWWSDSSH